MTTIELDHVAKIEGHAKLNISIEKNELMSLDLEIFEGARFFENILKGKKYDELPLVTSRICGVCSPNHALTSISAIEEAFEITPSRETKLLRELLAIGGLLQSHSLHLYFLILPDYKGYESAISMMPDYKDEIERALKIKKLGNFLVSTIGGRDIHPVTSVVGGFSKVPTSEDLKSLSMGLAATLEDAKISYELFSDLDYPEFEHKSTYMAMQGKHLFGDKISYLENGTLNHFPHDYQTFIKDYFQHDSTGEFVVMEGRAYTVGAQARVNVNWDNQDKELRDLVKIQHPFYSPFSNILFQSFEVLSSINRAIEILTELTDNSLSEDHPGKITPRKSTGIGVSEAPRGLLFHKYSFDEKGYCTYANVTTPTSQNLRTIEDCLRAFVIEHLNLPKEELINETEKLIRAFDPCISCSSH